MIDTNTALVLAATLWPVIALIDYSFNGREPGILRTILWGPLYIPIVLGYIFIVPYMRFSDWLFEVRE